MRFFMTGTASLVCHFKEVLHLFHYFHLTPAESNENHEKGGAPLTPAEAKALHVRGCCQSAMNVP